MPLVTCVPCCLHLAFLVSRASCAGSESCPVVCCCVRARAAASPPACDPLKRPLFPRRQPRPAHKSQNTPRTSPEIFSHGAPASGCSHTLVPVPCNSPEEGNSQKHVRRPVLPRTPGPRATGRGNPGRRTTAFESVCSLLEAEATGDQAAERRDNLGKRHLHVPCSERASAKREERDTWRPAGHVHALPPSRWHHHVPAGKRFQERREDG